MIVQNRKIYQEYKPLRNHLRNLGIEDSLYVIWAYIRFLQYNKPFPIEIEVSPKFLNAPLPKKGIYPWTLELLTREVLINSYKRVSYENTLTKYSYLAEIVNTVRRLEDKIARNYVNRDNISAEIFRTAYRQFPWQTHQDIKYLTRYFKIFNQTALNKIVQDTINLSVIELYLIGHAFIGAYLQSPAIKDYIDIGSEFLTREKFEVFTRHFARDINQIKAVLVTEQQFNDKYVYIYSSLKSFPIIRMKYQNMPCLVCPLPPMLFWRITSGLYYEINMDEHFSHHFGHSFQSYVGDVIAKARLGDRLKAIPDEEYSIGKKRKDTADWIISDEASNAAIFIECKTKRVNYSAKIELTNTGPLMDELAKMAEFIGQLYRALDDHKKNLYKSFKYVEGREIYPLIITLESWYISWKQLNLILKELVEKELKKSNLNVKLLDEMPYSICSIEEFEEMMQIMQTTGISKFMGEKVIDNEKYEWAFKEYVRYQFNDELKNCHFLFDDDYKIISSHIDLI